MNTDDAPNYEKDNNDLFVVICHSRKKFYNDKNIYWYEFQFDDGQDMGAHTVTVGQNRFIRVPDTKFYEFGGSHEDALKVLKQSKAFNITEGEEI